MIRELNEPPVGGCPDTCASRPPKDIMKPILFDTNYRLTPARVEVQCNAMQSMGIINSVVSITTPFIGYTAISVKQTGVKIKHNTGRRRYLYHNNCIRKTLLFG